MNRELESPDIWNNPEYAQQLGRERSLLDKTVNGIREIDEGLAGAGELLELAEMENDEDTAQAVAADVERYAGRVDKLEFQRMFSGEMDSANAFVDIQAGAGGTEAQDWAEMLLRMYLRWAESRGWKTEACTGWCASRRSTPTTAATPASPRCSSRRKSTTTSPSTSTRPT